jgi:chemotaxis methyl-accepting protein methylase
MIATICAADVDGFRALVTRKLGLFFDDGKGDFLADVLRQRMERTACSHFAEYERRLAPLSCQDGEIRTLAEALTIGETYFFSVRRSIRGAGARGVAGVHRGARRGG